MLRRMEISPAKNKAIDSIDIEDINDNIEFIGTDYKENNVDMKCIDKNNVKEQSIIEEKDDPQENQPINIYSVDTLDLEVIEIEQNQTEVIKKDTGKHSNSEVLRLITEKYLKGNCKEEVNQIIEHLGNVITDKLMEMFMDEICDHEELKYQKETLVKLINECNSDAVGNTEKPTPDIYVSVPAISDSYKRGTEKERQNLNNDIITHEDNNESLRMYVRTTAIGSEGEKPIISTPVELEALNLELLNNIEDL